MDEKEKKTQFTYEELKEKYIDGKQKNNYVKTQKIASDYNMIVTFIISVMLFIGIGVFAGVYLDRYLNTTPLFILVFSFLGIGAAYRNLFKSITKHDKDKGSSKNE
jgi:F0F1-type ATP synthase assembly protein I